MDLNKDLKHLLFSPKSMLRDQQPLKKKKKKREREKHTKCLMPFIQLENQSKLTTFITKKREKFKSHPRTWGHGKALTPLGLPQESRLRTGGPGPRTRGREAPGPGKGRRRKQGPARSPLQRDRGGSRESQRIEFTDSAQHPHVPKTVPPTKQRASRNSKHPVLRAQAAAGKSKPSPSGRMLGGMASKISSILESLGILPQVRREGWGLGKRKSHPERVLSG